MNLRSMKYYPVAFLICISPVNNEFQHLFLSLLAFCEVFVQIFFPHFLVLLLIWDFVLYSGFKLFIRYMCYEHGLRSVTWLSSFLLQVVLWEFF